MNNEEEEFSKITLKYDSLPDNFRDKRYVDKSERKCVILADVKLKMTVNSSFVMSIWNMNQCQQR